MLAYFEGELRRLDDARISVTSFVVGYGLGAFTGLRAYHDATTRQLWLFRPADHFHRLRGAARTLMCGKIPPNSVLVETALSVLRANSVVTDSYLRVLLYKMGGSLGARVHEIPHDICMYLEDAPRINARPTAARLITSSWRRVGDATIPVRAKICGAYVNSALARSEAQLAGYDEPMMLDERGHLSEGAGANVFIIRDGVLITPPVSGQILEGITRASIIELARDVLGVEVVERPVDRSEFYFCDEAFMCGTARGIVPIESLDSRPIADGAPMNVTAKLVELYDAATRAQLPVYRERWCIPVYDPSEVGK